MKKYLKIFAFLGAIGFISGCSAPPLAKPNIPESSVHNYKIIIKDKSGSPVESAAVVAQTIDLATVSEDDDYKLKDLSRNTKLILCITGSDGSCTISIPAKLWLHAYGEWEYMALPGSKIWCVDDCKKIAPNTKTVKNIFKKKYSPAEKKVWGYASYLNVSVSRGGLFGLLTSQNVGYHKSADELNSTITIIGDTIQEYFCEDLKIPASQDLAQSLVKWSNSLGGSLASIQADIPKEDGICMTKFKEKQYIAITLNSNLKFNSIKMNTYSIGVSIFDEIVREILNPLGVAANSLAFSGYDIQVITRRENFINPENKAEKKDMKFRFIIPGDVVLQYKMKDITGQQVVDKSYILLNDERIDLKLQ